MAFVAASQMIEYRDTISALTAELSAECIHAMDKLK